VFQDVINECFLSYIHTWPISRRSERRRHENVLRKVLIQRNCEYRQCTTQELSFQCYGNSCYLPGRDLIRVLKRSPISQPHTLGLRRGYWEADGKAVGNTTKIASALENFPAAVIMTSAWPDWSKFQYLRSWHDPAEIRTTRTTTYQTWSERSNH